MSTDTSDRQQQKVREFMSLLPLTLALAGLPQSAAGQHFNEGQLDNRASTIKAAYKTVRQMLLDIAK